MVVELLLKPNARDWKFGFVLFVGIIYALVGALVALWLFESQLGIVMVFLTMLAGAPFMYQMIQYEEKKELSFHSEKQFLKEYAHILKALIALFIGMTIGFVIFFLAYNTYLDSTNTQIDVHVSHYLDDNVVPQNLSQEVVSVIFETDKNVKSFDYLFFQKDQAQKVYVANQHKSKEGYWWQSANVIVSVSFPKNVENKVRDMLVLKYITLYPPTQAQYHDVESDIDTAAYFFQNVTQSEFISADKNEQAIKHNKISYSLHSGSFDPQLRTMPLNLEANDKGFGAFIGILNNNMGVSLTCFAFSFLFGFGALFILVWNASYLAAAISGFLTKTLIVHSPLVASLISFGRFFTHGVFEILAFFLMGLAGSIISFGLMNHEFGTKKFLRTASDAGQLVVFAILILFLAAWIEVWITPLIFG